MVQQKFSMVFVRLCFFKTRNYARFKKKKIWLRVSFIVKLYVTDESFREIIILHNVSVVLLIILCHKRIVTDIDDQVVLCPWYLFHQRIQIPPDVPIINSLSDHYNIWYKKCQGLMCFVVTKCFWLNRTTMLTFIVI